ncbi:Vga family ABC-F type ribosomal protection protein [Alkalihalophilus marmarensis]|uniref:Vga family ABC-F type ribosomal protection protein n=1 Tax=Alkalihalophilus marmarensis TaxID=521377 RepID=UPI002E21AC7E|nr:ABC-F type ribosomal protection protein [Alkalihalophilus marmarensis]MED1602748.1 ABC-F type ribosomal protection protein [Alkalihalophilus marmarensis]
MLLEASNLRHSVADRMLFEIEYVKVEKGERIGLVGANGCGKTTLLKGLAEESRLDEGIVIKQGTCELLPQLKRTNALKSGGELTQEYINQALLKEPKILFADEPTTHLDTDHIEWLEKKFKSWKGALVIVSHDRAFLDAVCTKIWELSDEGLKEFKGNYTEYAKQKEILKRKHKSDYEKYEAKKKQLETALKAKEQKAKRATKKPKNVSRSEASITGAKPYFAKKQKKLQQVGKSIETRLTKLEKVEKPKEAVDLKMTLPHEGSMNGRIMIRIENLAGAAGSKLLWEKNSFHLCGGEKVAVIGPNGSGKTTFIKKIIEAGEGIKLSPSLKVGYFSQDLSILKLEKNILENVSEGSIQSESLIRTVLARLYFRREDVYKPVKVLSGGERVKVALAKLFVSDINALILDEPTNFLDVPAVEALESLLQEYKGSIVVVSHDRRFLENVATKVIAIERKQLKYFERPYKEYRRFESKKSKEERDISEDQALVLETKISEVLSRLSIEPTEELEKEFKSLIEERRKHTGNKY